VSDRDNPWHGNGSRDEPRPPSDVRSWSQFVDAVADAIIVYDANLHYVALNRAAADIYGYAPAELLGRSRDEVVGNDEHTPRMREALLTGRPIVVLNEVPTASGRRTFETIYQPHRGMNGGDAYLIGVARELSTSRERREREAQRRESSEVDPCSALRGSAQRGGVIRFDDDWRIVAWSRGAQDIFGWASSEVVGRRLSDVRLVHDDDVAAVVARLARTTEDAPLSDLQQNVHRDGRAMDCLWVTSRLEHENVGGFLSVVQDVTDAEVNRKNALLNEERLRSLFEDSPDGIGAVNREGIITEINDAALVLTGYARGEVVGRPFAAFFDEADLPPLLESFERSLQGEPQRIEARPHAKDGSYLDLEFTGSPIFSDGEVVGVYVALKDISAQRHAESALQRQHERIRELYLCATASNTSSEEQIRRTLELGCRMLGLDLAAIYDAQGSGTITVSVDVRGVRQADGATISERLCRTAMAAPDGLAVENGSRSALLAAGDGETALSAFIGVPVDAGGIRFGSLCFAATAARQNPFEPADRDLVALIGVLIGAEIERGRARLHLRSLAYYDALTGLPNRLLLRERLDAALVASAESGSKSAVLFLDLDRFKDVNDTRGHVLGDRLLQLAAERIVGCVRSSETVARMGGDEFIVVMPSIRETNEAIELTERLLLAIDAPFAIAEQEQYTTTSIGIAVGPDDGTDSDTLIKNADIAMYRAKDRGRNTYVLFSPEFDRSMSLRVSNEQGMRRAIERGEFRTYFQPVVDVQAGKIHGVEALARWQHPALSILRPESFISNAEENGLIVRLGEVVLEDACRQVLAWHAAGLRDLHLSVNLSARQFREPQLLELIGAILERTGFPARLLEIEVAEAVAMADAETSVGIMRELKAAGVRVLVDNFGTGYSSLGYLGRFPLDGIKVDRSFIGGIGTDRDQETIVRTMIGIAHTLRLDVVAEGVETADQVEFLRRERCERLQGHFYAPALPAVGCERYLRAWSALVTEEVAAGP